MLDARVVGPADAAAVAGAGEPASDPLPRPVARAAARWLMRLHSGEATDADRTALAAWRAADPEHERAWQRAEVLDRKLGLLPRGVGMRTLDREDRGAGPGRRAAFRTLVILLVGAPTSAYLARRWTGWDPAWPADHQTRTGEQREIVLADGTRVRLNTATSIDVDFGEDAAGPAGSDVAAERLVVLRRGEILVETGRDAENPAPDRRPFVVQTRDGRVRTLGARFIVRQLEPGEAQGAARGGATCVSVQRHAVEIQAREADHLPVIVRAGQRIRFDAAGLGPVEPTEPTDGAWVHGVLFARNQRLGDFLAELGRYRAGVLHCAPTAAGLRISGAFQLGNTDAVLAALPDTLPVRVVYRTRWWVTIDRRA